MKLINKLDETVEKSLYSGQSQRVNEMYLRPVPKYDETGKELKKSERYYVFRLLYFTSNDRDYPFIVRNEHTFVRRDAAGNIKEIKRICCPTTDWARAKIQEQVGRDYCPICAYSFEKKAEGWKNYKALGQIDEASLRMSRETERQWAAYLPVLVISDPIYRSNNNHFKVLRLAGKEGMSAYNRIREKIAEANRMGVTVFNGEEGANIALLCEKVEKEAENKDGEPVIDKKTGKVRVYSVNSVTDVQLLSKRLHSYSIVTEENLEKLAFDETYGVAAAKDRLQMFLSENYLDNGASDSDFDEEFGGDSSDFSGEAEPKTGAAPKTAERKDVENDENEFDDGQEDAEVDSSDDIDDDSEAETVSSSEDEDDEFADESPRDAIARITKGRISTKNASDKVAAAVMDGVGQPKKAAKKVSMQRGQPKMPKNVDALRENSLDIDPDDLPF
jgi:hypothetical protein